VHVERADQVADPLPAAVGGAVALGPAAASPAAAVLGLQALRPFSSKLITTPFTGFSR
jgi:hypothetical protein